jgi:excisionase family DNA binding protein
MVGPVAAQAVSKDLQPSSLGRGFTVAQVAALLQLHPKTVERAFRRGDIPAERCGRRWRISREALFRALVEGFGVDSPALRPELRDRTLKGRPRQRRAFIRRP